MTEMCVCVCMCVITSWLTSNEYMCPSKVEIFEVLRKEF